MLVRGGEEGRMDDDVCEGAVNVTMAAIAETSSVTRLTLQEQTPLEVSHTPAK
jgi:hypothetical protein